MKYRISDNSDSPAYLQLYRQLKQDIVDTVYAYGCKLPSKRLMAEDLGISTVTVEHAYYLLCDEGYVESRERSGYFVIFRTNDGFAASSNEHKLPAATVNNTHGTEPTFPFSVLAKTMRRVLSIHGEAMLDRSPSKGLSELSKCTSHSPLSQLSHRRYCKRFKASRIYPVVGKRRAIHYRR